MRTDLALYNARLLDPATGTLSPHTALAAAGGRITALGDDTDIRALNAAQALDLRGAVITPGLVDAHIHPASGAELTQGTDLSACTTLDQARTALEKAAAELPEGAWLRAWGLDPNVFGDTPPRTAALGPAMDRLPVLIQMFDAHSALASPPALALAGIDGPRTFDQAAEIVCDTDGRPTGLLLEDAACELVERAAPAPTRDQRRALLADALHAMAAAGLTGGHAMDANGDSLELYADLDRTGDLPLRLRVAPWCQPGATPADLADLIALQGTGGTLWRVAGVKMFMDGTIDNGTAWLEEPDRDGESATAFWPDPDAYTEAVRTLHTAGVPTATHAIGDAAVRHALDAVEHARHRAPGGPRHRIEHIETLPDTLLERFAALEVTASMQPTHCCDYTRADHTDNWSRRLGEERASRAWRCRDLWEAGATVVLGSDWPIAPFPPLQVMAGARHRRPTRDLTRPPHGPDQALDARQALWAMTTGPALAAGEEKEAGHLRIGYRADLTVFADDPLEVPATDLAHLPVTATVTGGRLVHRGPGLD